VKRAGDIVDVDVVVDGDGDDVDVL